MCDQQLFTAQADIAESTMREREREKSIDMAVSDVTVVTMQIRKAIVECFIASLRMRNIY